MRFYFVFLFLFVSVVLYSQVTPLNADDAVFVVVEEPPTFPGGMNALKNYMADDLKYPKRERRKHIEGKCYISFVMGKDGSVSDVTCVKGINEALDQEAIRVIQDGPSWKPGKSNGKAVAQRFVYPVEFKLPDKN